jgi:hypothetical protein
MAAPMLHLRSLAPAAPPLPGLDFICEAGHAPRRICTRSGMDVYWYES